MAKNTLFKVDGRLRSIWWVPIFFAMLTLTVFPLILLSAQYGFELTMPIQAAAILAVSWVCQLLRREPISELIGKIDFIWLKELLVGLGIGGALMAVPALQLTILGYVALQPNSLSYSTLSAGLIVCLGVAVAEELLFRGFLFQRLIQATGQWPAQLLLGGLFLLTHLGNPGMTGAVKIFASINIFLASLMFGLAYIKTKRLAMPIGLHFMANFMQGTILGFGVSGNQDPSLWKPQFNEAPIWLSGGDFGLEASVLGLLGVIIITVSLYYWKDR